MVSTVQLGRPKDIRTPLLACDRDPNMSYDHCVSCISKGTNHTSPGISKHKTDIGHESHLPETGDLAWELNPGLIKKCTI